MYTSGYNRLFWGIIFITFHINIGYISILPNFIGYMLIYSGLKILVPQQKVYEKGKLPAIILIILSIKDLFNNPNNILASSLQSQELVIAIIVEIGALINFYLIYVLFSGIYKLCEERNLSYFGISVKSSWKFYAIASLLTMFYIPLSINLTTDCNWIGIVAAVINILAYIFIAVLLKNCKVELKD